MQAPALLTLLPIKINALAVAKTALPNVPLKPIPTSITGAKTTPIKDERTCAC
jgi:hypothetical protein